MHLQAHFNRSVQHEEFTIHRCGRLCRSRPHYQCLYCKSTILRKPDFIKYLALCKQKHQPPTPHTKATTTSATALPTIHMPPSAATTLPTIHAIIHGLCELQGLSWQEAEEVFLQGPIYYSSEVEEFDRRIAREMKNLSNMNLDDL